MESEFLPYNREPESIILINDTAGISSFINQTVNNIDFKTIKSFGEEWLKFNEFSEEEIKNAGKQYFDIVNETLLNSNSTVLDIGCGSGRWTKYIAHRVKIVEAIDPSKSVFSAYQTNKNEKNVRITQAAISDIPFKDDSFDFIICLGVLHHVPNTLKALQDVVKKLKQGGTILLYLYYNFDNRGLLYKVIFHVSNLLRKVISNLPVYIKKIICDLIAISVYMPIVSLIRVLEFLFDKKKWIKKIPLSYYSDKSFNIIRNDSLDRFGTPLELRFSKKEIEEMMIQAGLQEIIFSINEPYWHAVGKKK